MSVRFVSRSIHAYLDYPVAFALMALPFALGLGASNPLALWLSVVTGAAAFVLTVFTDHHLGVWRVLPYKFHQAVDLTVGIIFIVAPGLFGFGGIDAQFYWINGAAVVAVIPLSAPEEGATA